MNEIHYWHQDPTTKQVLKKIKERKEELLSEITSGQLLQAQNDHDLVRNYAICYGNILGLEFIEELLKEKEEDKV